MAKLDWNKIVKKAIIECQDYYGKNGIAPTLRGLFYILVSKEIIPNTKSAYSTLSRHVAMARYLGRFPWDLIRDETRTFNWGEQGKSIEEADKMLNELQFLTPEEKEKLLKEVLAKKYEVRISKWYNQKHSILVVVEKEAQFDAINKIVNVDLQWDVSVTTSRGFESATATKFIADWIVKVKESNRIPVVFLIFDWDPSGEYAGVYDLMFRVMMLLSERKKKLIDKWLRARDLDKKGEIVHRLAGDMNIVFEKVMLTYDQVKKYNLPPMPQDEDVKKKLQRDPRSRMFMEKYGFLGQVEIDAMLALYYDETKKILDESIKKYFDHQLYEEVKKKEEELRQRFTSILGEKT